MTQFKNIEQAKAENRPNSYIYISIKDGIAYIDFGKTNIYSTDNYSEAAEVADEACEMFDTELSPKSIIICSWIYRL